MPIEYVVYDSQRNWMGTFPDYQSAMSYIQSFGNINTWKIK